MEKIQETSIETVDDYFSSPIAWSEMKHIIQESIRKILIRIQKNGEIPNRIAITSSLSGEGTTSVSLALAATLASDYQARVVLVDLNWSSPSQLYQNQMSIPKVVDIIDDEISFEEAMELGGYPNLLIIPSGELELSRRPIIARGNALKELINKLEQHFDYLIFDVPAVLTTSDAVPLASLGDACIFVVQQGGTPLDSIQAAFAEIDHLPVVGINIEPGILQNSTVLEKVVNELSSKVYGNINLFHVVLPDSRIELFR